MNELAYPFYLVVRFLEIDKTMDDAGLDMENICTEKSLRNHVVTSLTDKVLTH